MPAFTSQDCVYMARALQLARRGRFTAHPNPVVGCVLVKDDEIVGEGFHARTGEAHAEVSALESAGGAARAATAYVTLEPCAHHGKTPPCADALIAAGVGKVIIAMEDPSREVSGRGIGMLEQAGIEVETGLMQAAAADLNRGFVKRVTQSRPLVRLKMACSIDGAMAMADGESQWITGEPARRDVQQQRARAGAVMTGIGTVLADDPSLNLRAPELAAAGLQPLRVVLDSRLRMPTTARMLTLPGTTLVFTTRSREPTALAQAGAEVVPCSEAGGGLDLADVLTRLAARGVNELLVEAGPTLSGSLLTQGLVDELVIYQAPHIMGSHTMKLVDTPSWTSLQDRCELVIREQRRIGADTRITAEIRRKTG